MSIMLKKLSMTLTLACAFLSTLSYSGAQTNKDIKLRTVVLDAGHGGHDPGTVSPDRRLHESDINLDVVLEIGRRIKKEYPDVQVIYTRSTDVFIPLAERANIANRNHADLFMSVHVNSARKGSSASGTETFVMGTDKSASNMEVCRRENSVILLEDNYNATYQGFDPNNAESYIFFNLMQNAHFEQSIAMASMVQENLKKGPVVKSRGIKQAPLMVLWRTTMPSVLIEIGFLSNPNDRKVLSDSGQRIQIAGLIFDAFKRFKTQYDSHLGFTFEDQVSDADDDDLLGDVAEEDSTNTSVPVQASVQTPVQTQSQSPSQPVNQKIENEPCFRIQIFATGKKLKKGAADFKGVDDFDCTLKGGLYKYTIGRYPDREAAQRDLPAIKAKFKGAFVVFF